MRFWNRPRSIAFIVAPKYRYQLATVVTTLEAAGQRCFHVDPESCASLRRDPAHVFVTIHSLLPAVLDLFRSVRGVVPTLTVQDGIIEHAHCWERESSSHRYKPVVSDVLAVFGERSHALVTAWGGADAAEVVVTGCPRFDVYADQVHSPRSKPGSGVLLTCANTPFQDADSKAGFLAKFSAIARALDSLGIPFRIRIPSSLLVQFERTISSEGPLRNAAIKDASEPLELDLLSSAAVITTPSTVALEAMILGIPTALINFGTLAYLSSAWVVRDPDDLVSTIPEMLDPSLAKMLYQNLVKDENVVADGHATDRVCELITRMAG